MASTSRRRFRTTEVSFKHHARVIARRNRQANNALWRTATARLRVDERTIAYAQ